jgi:Cyclomaltodextrinase, N-terminal
MKSIFATRPLGAIAVFVLALSALVEAQVPAVRKVDPPNWWVNYTPELTLLLTGENLNGARVESPTKGLTVLGSEASVNGHYLFVHLQLHSGLPAETASLRVTTSAGSTTVQLPLLARADPRARFEGFSRDDVFYLIMPDRFADGDPSNDRSCASRRKMKISCSSSTTTHRRRSNSRSPSKTRLLKLRASYRQCLGTPPRSLQPVTCTSY